MDCADFAENIPGKILRSLSSPSKMRAIKPEMYLSTRQRKDATYIGPHNWTGIQYLDPSKMTYIIMHGFKSSGKEPWVVAMKNKLLERADVNLIVIHWEQLCQCLNYVDAAHGTLIASDEIFRLFSHIRRLMEEQQSHEETHDWSSLYFIGHSLGAHISAQVSYLMSGDNFWQIKRITGLDPAQPCFQRVNFSLKLDKHDADFVDVIHTQAGNFRTFNFGLREDLGHMDFYVNGGVVQPACTAGLCSVGRHVCSHTLAHTYFTESISHSLNKNCQFMSFKWDGSQADAMSNFNLMRINASCHDCPRMGIDAPVYYSPGKYIVFTGAKAPYCSHPKPSADSLSSRLRRSTGSFPASIEDYPFVASIRVAGGHVCGGSILTKNIVLTASHCINQKSNPLNVISVKVGDADINHKGSWHSVVKIIQHEDNELEGDNVEFVKRHDVALIKLKTPIELNNKTIKVVKLFDATDNVWDYDMGILIGWGYILANIETDQSSTSENGTRFKNRKIGRVPRQLMDVELDIGPREKCDEFLRNDNSINEFCTYTLGRKGCSGDSGSPFMVNGRQAGINSWSSDICDSDANTSVFVDIAKYRSWIDQHVKILSRT
ncbi:hypothetical protein QAD02_008614 [Eretmocerus hayati]|uniref:Uncharacterized protein n=1 Tax=Eretmocerus hayati TaxID=131215 RepID=A0ACC2N7B5_9HYME|nr:hypothetical protein QAD02_008614 [Eretmocerus hayati]